MAKEDQPPSFQFYPRDLLTSRKVLAMSPEGRGAYLFLLCHAWLSDQPGTLPDNDHLLSALSGLTPDLWSRVAGEVLDAFDRQAGRLVQPRLVEERESQKKRHQRAVQGGKARSSGERDSSGRLLPSQNASHHPGPASASASAIEDRISRARALNGKTETATDRIDRERELVEEQPRLSPEQIADLLKDKF